MNMPDNGRLAARLREETAELLSLLPAARQAAAGGPGGGEAAGTAFPKPWREVEPQGGSPKPLMRPKKRMPE